ncbi:ankyrin repeat-containing protein [Tieghemostelium lacteum]|uniref:Ankyrin repeat-containing protein n=1 Tax=Tieghemostelium lacteum TaxID=361077 RepID=A0A151ZH19_TIELA|nr:ankyrin repeat-containing protein [Tieghemostelium lacteum]|eukprot:KYQ93170.1 ankyrin repeat-containing protein [Tieghemostelium lacteum]
MIQYGVNEMIQYGIEKFKNKNIKSIVTNSLFILIVTNKNEFHSYRMSSLNVYKELVLPNHLKLVSSIACGFNHCHIILSTSNEIYGMGDNYSNQLGLDTKSYYNDFIKVDLFNDKSIHSISSGRDYSIVYNDYKVYTVGTNNTYGQLGINESIPLDIIRAVDWSTSSLGEELVKKIVCGDYHNLILTKSGKVKSFGWNQYYQCGLENANDQSTPRLIESIGNVKVVDITCSSWHSVFLSADGRVYSCGWNINGQLGQNDTLSRSIPTLIESLDDLVIQSIQVSSRTTVLKDTLNRVFICGFIKYFKDSFKSLSSHTSDQIEYPKPIIELQQQLQQESILNNIHFNQNTFFIY